MTAAVELNVGQVADKLAALDRSMPLVLLGGYQGRVADVYVDNLLSDDAGKPVQAAGLLLSPLDRESALQDADVLQAVDDYIERGGQLAALLEWLESNG